MSTGIDFEDLYRTHWAELFRYALGITGRVADAEDAVQEAFLTAWDKRGEWTYQGRPPVAWLMTITRLTALSMLKARYRLGIPAGEALDRLAEARTVVQDVDTTPCLADAGVAERVEAALSGLPKRQRQALRLRYLDGLGWAAAGSQMGLTIKGVQTNAYSGLRRLRTMAGAA